MHHLTQRIAGLLVVLVLLLAGCDRVPELPSFDGSTGVPVRMVVVNEGLFTTNTAALSVIYADGTVYYDVFRYVNQRPLGDVAQSLTVIHDLYFVAVNNSRRIEILDPTTFESVGSIRYERAGSPRYIAPLTDSTAVVSDLHNQLVTIRTRPPYTELDYIELPFKTSGIEQMAVSGGKLFGAYLDRGVAVFDTDNFRISGMRLLTDVVPTWGTSTARPLVDYRGWVWFLTTPRMKDDRHSMTLQAIDPVTERIAQTMTIPYVETGIHRGDIVGMPSYNRIDISPTKDRIYISLHEATKDDPDPKADKPLQVVYTLDLRTMALERYMPLPEVQMMYGMNVSPEGDVCICDCLDYTAQRGYIRVYPADGGPRESYKVAVYPNFVFFPSES